MKQSRLESSTDELIASELLWSDINVGDKIELEADFVINGEVVLKAGEAYLVIAKHQRSQGAPFDAFYVESECQSTPVAVSPVFISNYILADTPPHLS